MTVNLRTKYESRLENERDKKLAIHMEKIRRKPSTPEIFANGAEISEEQVKKQLALIKKYTNVEPIQCILLTENIYLKEYHKHKLI